MDPIKLFCYVLCSFFLYKLKYSCFLCEIFRGMFNIMRPPHTHVLKLHGVFMIDFCEIYRGMLNIYASPTHTLALYCVVHWVLRQTHVVIPRQSRGNIVLASYDRPFCLSFRPSGAISQYLFVRFDSFLVQMTSTMAIEVHENYPYKA